MFEYFSHLFSFIKPSDVFFNTTHLPLITDGNILILAELSYHQMIIKLNKIIFFLSISEVCHVSSSYYVPLPPSLSLSLSL